MYKADMMCKVPFGDCHTHSIVLKKHENKGERGTDLSGHAVQQVPQKDDGYTGASLKRPGLDRLRNHVSSSTSQASDKFYRDMLNSIKEEPSGTSMSYKALYQNTLRSIMGFYRGSITR